MSATSHLDAARGADTADELWTTFQSTTSIIRSSIEDLGNLTTAEERSEKLKILKNDLQVLQKYTTASTRVLPPYDIRRTQETLESLNTAWRTADKTYQPKKAFAFSSRNKLVRAADKAAAVVAEETAKQTTTTDAPASGEFVPPPGACMLRDLVDVTIERNVSEDPDFAEPPLYLRDIRNCTIKMSYTHGSVRIEGAQNCKIILGPVSTSVYIEGAVDCVLHIACHQLRIHNSHRCVVYCRVNSHPIIEDCTAMGFAPYNFHYDGINEHFQKTGLADADCYANVVDFHWHRTTPSPNWHVVAEEERDAPVIV